MSNTAYINVGISANQVAHQLVKDPEFFASVVMEISRWDGEYLVNLGSLAMNARATDTKRKSGVAISALEAIVAGAKERHFNT